MKRRGMIMHRRINNEIWDYNEKCIFKINSREESQLKKNMRSKRGGHSKKGKQQSNLYIMHKQCTERNHIKVKRYTYLSCLQPCKHTLSIMDGKVKIIKTNIQWIENGKICKYLI